MRDVVSHLTAVARDWADGRLTGAPTDEETAEHIRRFGGLSESELLEAWSDTTDHLHRVAETTGREPPLGDIGEPGARDAESVMWTADRLLTMLAPPVPLRVAVEDQRAGGRHCNHLADNTIRSSSLADRAPQSRSAGRDGLVGRPGSRFTITCICSAPRAPTSSNVGRFRTSIQNLTRVKPRCMDNIRGKTIAITGAARGIGYATATALLERGARVVIGDRDVALQESAVAQLTKGARYRDTRST